ncbi:folate-binding protein YgfZ [uncultured Tessaracoccus sp.]|uniref:CAF17-like 4Fe-4S cluster assembly/insertion protein YgfZ n=1 Tax=uncultured Tessaracoccus sp. TaxID=905023 RepID=UPI0025E11F5B|nr:folate-binding protein [uncultured Tessaracoccus sp.]
MAGQEILLEDGVDEGSAWHLGRPAAEGRRIADGGGVFRYRRREVVELRGEDRLEFLHLVSTADVRGLAPGSDVAALVLDAQGHLVHALHGVDDGQALVGWVEAGRADALVEHVERMRFAMRVEVRRRDDLHVHWVGADVDLPDDAVVRPSFAGGREVFTTAVLPDDVGAWAVEAARIANGVPRMFVDTDDRTIPNELGLYATALDKGCYPGQETVAKVHTLGRPPRRLTLLHLDGSEAELPALGADLLLGERTVGRVGSAALHHELGPIALALVKRSVDVEAELEVDGVTATQEVLVDPDVGLHVRPLR